MVVPQQSPHAVPINLIVQSVSSFATLNNFDAHVAPSIAPPSAKTTSLSPALAPAKAPCSPKTFANLPLILGNFFFNISIICFGPHLLKSCLILPGSFPDFSVSFLIKLLKNSSTIPAIFLKKPPEALLSVAFLERLFPASFILLTIFSAPSVALPFTSVFTVFLKLSTSFLILVTAFPGFEFFTLFRKEFSAVSNVFRTFCTFLPALDSERVFFIFFFLSLFHFLNPFSFLFNLKSSLPGTKKSSACSLVHLLLDTPFMLSQSS